MIDIKKRIATIEALLVEGSAPSVTYAAMECRLTIEMICYERFLHSQEYISTSDLKNWQPKAVVKQVSEEANELIDKGFELHISTTPVQAGAEPQTKEDYESFKYVKVGQQVGFKLSKMGSLWNALSRVALHVDCSKGKDGLSLYGDVEAIKAKVSEALAEFRKLELNTLIGGGLGINYNFSCDTCCAQIKRKAALLKDGQVIGCITPSCDESYAIHRDGDEITYSRRTSVIKCIGCSSAVEFPTRRAENLRYGETLVINCPTCSANTNVSLRIMQETTVVREWISSLGRSRVTPSISWSGGLCGSPANDKSRKQELPIGLSLLASSCTWRHKRVHVPRNAGIVLDKLEEQRKIRGEAQS
jgi:hypothetical protein